MLKNSNFLGHLIKVTISEEGFAQALLCQGWGSCGWFSEHVLPHEVSFFLSITVKTMPMKCP